MNSVDVSVAAVRRQFQPVRLGASQVLNGSSRNEYRKEVSLGISSNFNPSCNYSTISMPYVGSYLIMHQTIGLMGTIGP